MLKIKTNQNAASALKKRADFLHVQSKGQKWVSHGLVLQAYRNEGLGQRVGFTVTKKIDTRAVKRNRIKRRLRSVASDVLPAARDNMDYILVGRALSSTRPYEKLCQDLLWCLGKLDLLKESGDV